MPLFRITVSEELEDGQKRKLALEASKLVSGTLGKPESYMQAVVMPKAEITFGGSPGKSAFVEIKSIGSLSPDNCKALSSGICSLLEKELSLPAKRIYIEFSDVKSSFWGWNHSTF